MTTFYDRVKMSVASAPGTGAVTLGSAVTGYRSFDAAAVADQAVVSYAIEDGGAWEVGHGTYTKSGTLLTRTSILASSAGGAAIGADVNAVVYLTLLAADIAALIAAVPSSGSTYRSARYWRISDLFNNVQFVGTGILQFLDGNGNAFPISSYYSNGDDTDPIANAFDTDLTSYWTTYDHDRGFLAVDLGSAVAPQSVVISSRNGRTDCNIIEMSVDWSNDKVVWHSTGRYYLTWTGQDSQVQTLPIAPIY